MLPEVGPKVIPEVLHQEEGRGREIQQRSCMNVQIPGHQGSTEELQEGHGRGESPRPWRAHARAGSVESCRKGQRKSCRKVQQEDPAEGLPERPATRTPRLYGGAAGRSWWRRSTKALESSPGRSCGELQEGPTEELQDGPTEELQEGPAGRSSRGAA